MRAFLAGRLDLTQAEAVLGVIEAEQRGWPDHALRQLSGNLSAPLELARSEMLNLLADVEAGLDFVDEDIEFISEAALADRLGEIRIQLSDMKTQMFRRQDQQSKTVIVIRGEPNAGKSQLANALVGREVAIVANVAGTTRDIVCADFELDGHLMTLIDTAGIEESDEDSALGMITRESQKHGELLDIRRTFVFGASTKVDLVLLRPAKNCATSRLRGRKPHRTSGWRPSRTSLKTPLHHLGYRLVQRALRHDQLRRTLVETVQQRDQHEIGSVMAQRHVVENRLIRQSARSRVHYGC